MNRTRAVLFGVAVAASVLGPGCGGGPVSHNYPNCAARDDIASVTLEAQSVPTASRVPCLTELPPGVSLNAIRIRSGRSEFTIGSDRAGLHALVVRLERRCDTRGATEITSDQTGTRRFERILSVTPGFDATRYYTFTGGCITYRFHLSAKGRALVNEISLAVGSISRAKVDAAVRRLTDGHDHL